MKPIIKKVNCCAKGYYYTGTYFQLYKRVVVYKLSNFIGDLLWRLWRCNKEMYLCNYTLVSVSILHILQLL